MNQDDDKSTNPQENQNEAKPQDEAITEDHSPEQKTEKVEESSNEDKQEDTSSDESTDKTWHNKNALKRGIAMLGFGFLAGFVRLAITLIAVFQFFSLLFAEKPNLPLVKFGQNLNTYLYQINQFLTVNSEMYPFPFAEWPDSAPK